MKVFFERSGLIFRRGYALIFAFVFLFYISLSALPAVLMESGHNTAGDLIYKGFHYFCHQYPWRSWFLGGKQSCYPLISDPDSSLLTIEEASGLPFSEIDSRKFYGTAEMGYKMAVCQRDTAIYAAMALFSLVFFLTGNRIPRISLKLWLAAGIFPIGIDGVWQLASQIIPAISFRESTPLLRTATGALFGFFTCWYLLPRLERSLQEGENNDRQ